MAIAVTLIAKKREVAIRGGWVFRGANVKRSGQRDARIGKPDGKSLYEPYFLPESR